MTQPSDDRATDRAIAERLGWHTFTARDWYDGYDWRHGDLHGIAPGGDDQEPVPDYSTNLIAAIMLVGNLWFQCRNDPTFGWYVTLSDDDGVSRERSADTLAEAICRAYLAYSEATAARGEG